MKKLFCIVCLTVALSANAFPANAQIPWRVLRPFLQGLGSAAGNALIDATLNPQDNAFAAYTDGEWLVTVDDTGNDFIYYGVHLETENSISLRGAVIQGNRERYVYIWRNGNYRYQLAYRPNDPGVVRLQVFEGSRELLNRLLYRYQPDS